VLFFEPAGAPKPEAMPIRTDKPNMTLGRAVILTLMDHYTSPLFQEFVSLLEVQKLAYFQQIAGEKLKLEFVKGAFGPYADNLRHVLNAMEGHFISGWGDGQNRPRLPLNLLPGAKEAAHEFLKEHHETQKRFERVARLIEGFETPYGMELLGTVHWVITNELGPQSTIEEIAKAVREWTKRKQHLFTEPHIQVAYRRLMELGWASGITSVSN
jgi:hypothetical protein